MNLDYSSIFAHRGHSYHAAMLAQPRARSREFELLFEAAPVRRGQRVLDVPAGGGYLAGYLPERAELCSLELTDGFGGTLPLYDPAAAWRWGQFDHAVCLAALHHVVDQRAFLSGLLEHLAPDGVLHVADVAHGSSITRFLDEFIGRYNLTGHAGTYLAADPEWFAAIGHVARMEERSCPWRFASEQDMLEFCTRLFGLVDCPERELREALARGVGIEHSASGVLLQWRLLYVDLKHRRQPA